MKIFYSILFLSYLLPSASAQIIYPNDYILDSTVFTFSKEDSLIHFLTNSSLCWNCDTPAIKIDTSLAVLWQIGNTLKPIFSNDTVAERGIMTDTLNPYPKNANDFFILKMDHSASNFIVDFWHKYEIDSFHAGGIIEFSTDTGATWMNIVRCNYVNALTQNFYSQTDTIFSGEPAFTGISKGEQLSRFQFINCEAFRTTVTNCGTISATYQNSVFFRFRFVSDSTNDSLSGWMIDSIKIENPGCIGAVAEVSQQQSQPIFPNPANDELTIQNDMYPCSVSIINIMGQTIKTLQTNKQQETINVSNIPPGVYNVNITTESGYRENNKIVIMH
jgi:hypothetical protein